MSDIRIGAASRQEFFRVTPSDGLSERQVGAALQHLGLDAIQFSLGQTRPGSRGLARGEIAPTICRYLNSGFPVILTKDGHVTVLIGYGRDPSGELFFVQCDESSGPYGRYELAELLGDWRLLLVPVPGKIYLTGESAEVKARTIFANLLNDELPPERHVSKETLRLRSYVTLAGRYKLRMEERGLGPLLCDNHRYVGTSTWIWVVELQDRNQARTSPRCVTGEVAFDATSSDLSPGLLFGHFRANALVWRDAVSKPRSHAVEDQSPYLSATVLHDPLIDEPGARGLRSRISSARKRRARTRMSELAAG